MSGTKYLEFDSSYRNRNENPNPCDFIIEMGQSGQKSKENALDPVCYSSPILYWDMSFDEDTVNNIETEGQLSIIYNSIPNNSPSDNAYLYIKCTGGHLREIKNFYNGCVLSGDINGTVIYRRIVSYEFISYVNPDSYAMIKLDTALPSGTFSSGKITNPTITDITDTSSIIKVFIPASVNIDGYYNNYYIYRIDEDGKNIHPDYGKYQKIISYDGTLHLAALENKTETNWFNSIKHLKLVLRKELPIYNTKNLSIFNTSKNIIQLEQHASNKTDIYNNLFIYTNQYAMKEASIISSIGSNFKNHIQISDYIAFEGKSMSTTQNTTNFTLSSDASSIDNFYNGYLISVPSNDGTYLYTAEIISYNGATKSGTVSNIIEIEANSTVSPNNPSVWPNTITNQTWFIKNIKLKNPLDVNTSINICFLEILDFSKDNYNPFIYTGTTITSQELVCYEVELLNLIIPNAFLKSSRGGRPIHYPYIYVGLQNMSSSMVKNIIYSNNPNSSKMLFRVPMDDTPLPFISPFLKIDGDGMKHIIKFKPNDSFRLTIQHSTGEILQYEEIDNLSPTEINELLQVSACFLFKRI